MARVTKRKKIEGMSSKTADELHGQEDAAEHEQGNLSLAGDQEQEDKSVADEEQDHVQ